jgi:phosphoribosyl 1,2-cyclic phosphodiesterase
VEVRSSKGTLIIIDGGSGLRLLGVDLIAKNGSPIAGSILISHTHWDHIQGIPFFQPFFNPRNHWDLYAPCGLESSVHDILSGQMQHHYFPLALDQLRAHIHYHELLEGSFYINDVMVRTQYLNHPCLTLGYRLEADGASIVYFCDHEPYSLSLAKGEPDSAGDNARHRAFLQNADLVIFDSQYTVDEYRSKVGWGHGTMEYAMELCRSCGVKRVAFSHHDPQHDDKTIEENVARIKQKLESLDSTIEAFAAVEGLTLQLSSPTEIAAERPPPQMTAALMPFSHNIIDKHVLLIGSDPASNTFLTSILEDAGIPYAWAKDRATAIKEISNSLPSLILLIDNADGKLEITKMCNEIRSRCDNASIIIVADNNERRAEIPSNSGIGWLIRPFSLIYAKYLIHAWLLRHVCLWQRAPLPPDEDQRLEALKSLQILDTPPEERFDRLTRIASTLFDVPMVLISLIDSDRQWFKSACGLQVMESPRELSFCAHMLTTRQPLLVPDTLQDERFAENPFVLSPPYIRSYAGMPLILPSGKCLGSICLLDVRPRRYDSKQLGLLRDLRDLAVQELQRPTSPPTT